MKEHAVRQHGYVEFAGMGVEADGWRIGRGRAKTFLVEWCENLHAGADLSRLSKDEAIVVFPKGGGQVTIGETGSETIATEIPGRTIVIVPPGQVTVRCSDVASKVILLSPLRADAIKGGILNAGDYPDNGDEGMRAIGSPSGIVRPLQIIRVDEIVAPKDKPRLKIVRSESLSVSWIEYVGVRDRTQLSPHDHADFEQGSLAIEGDFIHHLRVPWGADATRWRDDLHVGAAPMSLCVVPPRVIHTSEGKGEGRHVLLDIFAPIRDDFVAKGWVFNQAVYPDG